MTLAYWMIMLAGVMPIIWAGYAKLSRKGYDNSSPREFLAKLDGQGQRANWAQQNAWEAFAPFAAAVIIAHLCGLQQIWIDNLAMSFIGCRFLYGVFYILDRSILRSLVWAMAFGCVIALYVLSAMYGI